MSCPAVAEPRIADCRRLRPHYHPRRIDRTSHASTTYPGCPSYPPHPSTAHSNLSLARPTSAQDPVAAHRCPQVGREGRRRTEGGNSCWGGRTGPQLVGIGRWRRGSGGAKKLSDERGGDVVPPDQSLTFSRMHLRHSTTRPSAEASSSRCAHAVAELSFARFEFQP